MVAGSRFPVGDFPDAINFPRAGLGLRLGAFQKSSLLTSGSSSAALQIDHSFYSYNAKVAGFEIYHETSSKERFLRDVGFQKQIPQAIAIDDGGLLLPRLLLLKRCRS